MTTYIHHRIACAPRRWRETADMLAREATALAPMGGALYGLWRSQIGRPRDEVVAITAWSSDVAAGTAEALLLGTRDGIEAAASLAMHPTLRPQQATPPGRQGNYAFRWFVTPERHWEAFLALCAEGWPGFEAAYDSQVIGLWRCTQDRTGAAGADFLPPVPPGAIASLLLTRRPDLATWERSKLPQGESETAVREALSRRYDLCDWTAVCTTTLLTATDRADLARWA